MLRLHAAGLRRRRLFWRGRRPCLEKPAKEAEGNEETHDEMGGRSPAVPPMPAVGASAACEGEGDHCRAQDDQCHDQSCEISSCCSELAMM